MKKRKKCTTKIIANDDRTFLFARSFLSNRNENLVTNKILRILTVGNEYPPWTPLVDYLRKERISTGTKAMCREGGCGICVVEAKLYEPLSDSMKSYPINSVYTVMT